MYPLMNDSQKENDSGEGLSAKCATLQVPGCLGQSQLPMTPLHLTREPHGWDMVICRSDCTPTEGLGPTSQRWTVKLTHK